MATVDEKLLHDRARTMRTNQTPAERRMWAILRGSRLGGLKFCRQAVIGSYVADFLCPALALIVEVDGASHTDPDRDARRDSTLAAQGYRVLRFANWQVLEQGEMVAKSILEHANQLPARWTNGPRNGSRPSFPTPSPSPEGKGN
ncbi:endonuclease domain-containing protein [Sandarakinorhabdus sp.]|uniref:endonuclease domain-containing protein n=1 Tax=Sandarakinorhabdus sp. TaxID=1916663 RepID=UPI003F7198CE